MRRVIKHASAESGSPTYAECVYRDRAFRATRGADRQPWQVVFDVEEPLIDDVSHAAVARVDGRIAELRVAMLPVSQEPALEHTPDRRWWKFWGRA